MPQTTATRIEYDAYVPSGHPEQSPLQPIERREEIASARAFHICALWFLLSNLDLNHTPHDTEEIGMQIRSIGSLGGCISQGLFHDIEEFVEIANNQPRAGRSRK